MNLRAQQKELTRSTIVGAVYDLLKENPIDDLTVPAVSRRSGVSLATIYRYFPTRDDLLAAASQESSRRARTATVDMTQNKEDLDHAIRRLWHQLAGDLPMIRYQVTSPGGRDLRRARAVTTRVLYGDAVTRFGVDPSTREGQRLVSVLMAIAGSLGVLELHDRQQLDLDEAVDAALWACHALIDATVDLIGGEESAQS